MRVGRAYTAGRSQAPFAPWAPNSIFQRNNEDAPRAATKTVAYKIANQLNYANVNYSYDGKAAPSFYGYSGYGYGGNAYGFQCVANIGTYTQSLWIMPPGSPRQYVTYVQNNGLPWPAGTAQSLQKYFESVPMPLLANVPSGLLVAGGSDREMTIFDLGTGEMWELFALGGSEGAYTFKYGGYVGKGAVPGGGFQRYSEGNGIYPKSVAEGAWGSRAVSIYGFGGEITHQDIVEVLRGGKIKHALQIGLCSTNPGAVAPSTRYDASQLLPQFLQDGLTPNPAWKSNGVGTDAVSEASWFVFPKASRASDFNLTKPFEVAVFEAIRQYGMCVSDTSGTASFAIESLVSLGSKYSWAKVNPWATALNPAYRPSYVPASWTDSSLPAITEQFYSGTGEGGFTSGVFHKTPWQELEQLEPFSS